MSGNGAGEIGGGGPVEVPACAGGGVAGSARTEADGVASGWAGVFSRRRVLALSGVAVAGLASGGSSAGHAAAARVGIAGVTSPPPEHAMLVSVEVSGSSRREFGDVLRRLGERVAGLPDGAEALVGLGVSLFDKAGVTDRRPRQLALMPSFDGDVLDPGLSHGDVLLQFGGVSALGLERARRQVLDGLARVGERWSIAGFRPESRVERGRALSRNLFGFMEGYGNPDLREKSTAATVRGGAGEPEWAVGGSYQVVRVIRFATESWDADPVGVQERVIGRRRDGRWLDGTSAGGRPDFRRDLEGRVTPLDAHVRRANPTSGAPVMVRRGFSYRRGRDGYGQVDEGLAFVCFQGDLKRGFEAVQRRLAGEALSRYTLTVGGGYFFVPLPQFPDRWWGDAVFG